MARLTAENRTTREWFKSRLAQVWEMSRKRDEVIGEVMKNILENSEEMSRHLALRETGEKLEGLICCPSPTQPTQTQSIPSPITRQKSPTPPKSPTPLAPHKSPTPPPKEPSLTLLPQFPFPDPEPSNKRPADEIVENNKRRKIGES